MKKIIGIMLASLALFNCSISATAIAESNESHCTECFRTVPDGVEKPTKEEVNNQYVLSGCTLDNIDFITSDFEMVTASSVISVAVTEPCDETWRNKYPDTWMWEANRTVIAADDMLTNRFGIQFYSVSQKYWNHNISGSNPSAMVTNAHNQWGLCDGADIMMAFTDKVLTSNGYGIYGLVESIGSPYLLVTCYGYTENCMTVRHEVGHCYGLTHCASGTNCVMADAAPSSTYDQLCSTHNTQWNNAKSRY